MRFVVAFIASIASIAAWVGLAGSATAYAVYFDIGGSTLDPETSDRVSVDVLLDVGIGEAGLDAFSIGVLAHTDVFSYEPSMSSNPTYILYTPDSKSGAPPVYMVPTSTPMPAWPSPPPGFVQINVAYQESNLGTTRATGLGILLATLVFHVDDGSVPGSIDLTLSEGGTFFRRLGVAVYPPIGITLGPAVTIVPEPTTAVLVGVGLAAVTVASRRRRRSSR